MSEITKLGHVDGCLHNEKRLTALTQQLEKLEQSNIFLTNMLQKLAEQLEMHLNGGTVKIT